MGAYVLVTGNGGFRSLAWLEGGGAGMSRRQVATATLDAYVYTPGTGGFRSLLALELGGAGLGAPGVRAFDFGLPAAWAGDIGFAGAYAWHHLGTTVAARSVAVNVLPSSVSAAVAVVGQRSAAFDAFIGTSGNLAAGLSAAVRAQQAVAATVDAALQVERAGTAPLAGAVASPGSASAATSGAVLASPAVGAALSAVVQGGGSGQLAALDAAVAVVTSAAAPLSGFISGVEQLTVQMQAVVVVERVRAIGMSAVVWNAQALQASLGAYVIDPVPDVIVAAPAGTGYDPDATEPGQPWPEVPQRPSH
jgi:hypothetical protein